MYQNIECASMILYTVGDPNYRLFRYSDRGHVKWFINQITIGILTVLSLSAIQIAIQLINSSCWAFKYHTAILDSRLDIIITKYSEGSNTEHVRYSDGGWRLVHGPDR